VAGECSGVEAVEQIARLRPEILFLDVQMPEVDGFEVLARIGADAVPAVVFVTAYDHYALRAFEVHAIDYLLKPFSEERVGQAIERAKERLGHPHDQPPPTLPSGDKLRAEVKRDSGPVERVLIRDGSRVHVLPVGEIDFVQAQDDYVCFHVSGKEFLKEQPLAEVEATLDPARFVRAHRSYLLNVDRLARVEPLTKDSRIAILKDGRRLPLSRAGYQRLNALL
jgi:two-component system LytT family response regulator